MTEEDQFALPPKEGYVESSIVSEDSEEDDRALPAVITPEVEEAPSSTAIVPYGQTAITVGSVSYPILATAKFDQMGAVKLDSLAAVVEFSKLAFQSGLFEGVKNPAQAVMKVTFGMQLGLSPMQSLNDVYIVKGQSSVQSRGILARFEDSPVYDLEIIELTDDKCTVRVSKNGKPKTPDVTATYKEYNDNGITNKLSWKVDRQGQLLNKAAARAHKRHAANLFNLPVNAREDLEDMIQLEQEGRLTAEGNLIPAPPVDLQKAALGAIAKTAKAEPQKQPEKAPSTKKESAASDSPIVPPVTSGENKKPDTSPLITEDMLDQLIKIVDENKWTPDDLEAVCKQAFDCEPDQLREKQWTRLVDHIMASAPGAHLK